MAIKKKRSPAQIAATKKLVALNKAKARKKNKHVGTSQTKASQITRKPPSARLKKRRTVNTRKGFFPNPVAKYWVIGKRRGTKTVFFCVDGFGILSEAARFGKEKEALRIAKKLDKKHTGIGIMSVTS